MPNSSLAQVRDSFAVLNFEGKGISSIEASVLADRLEAELVNTNEVTVVERGKMLQILSEQDFQISGCTSNECAVEVGQLIGVTKMIAGSIGKIGLTFSINLRIIDVGTGTIVNSIIRDHRGEIDGLLIQMRHISQELVKYESGAPGVIVKPAPPVVSEEPAPRVITGNGSIRTTMLLEELRKEPIRIGDQVVALMTKRNRRHFVKAEVLRIYNNLDQVKIQLSTGEEATLAIRDVIRVGSSDVNIGEGFNIGERVIFHMRGTEEGFKEGVVKYLDKIYISIEYLSDAAGQQRTRNIGIPRNLAISILQ